MLASILLINKIKVHYKLTLIFTTGIERDITREAYEGHEE